MKLYVRFGWFFIDNFKFTNSFGLGLFVELEFIISDQGTPVRHPGKSIGESFGEVKVSTNRENQEFLDREMSPGLK